MKFTIVTSFYNGSKFVLSLYDKIKKQTYTNWEWVVTDDFSSDDTKNILLDISKHDRKVKYVEQTFKKEMFYNPQRFCRDAEIIVQIDQDDYPLPKSLSVYHHFFTKFSDVSLITCAGTIFYENDEWVNFHNLDYSKVNNMTCGYLTMLRAWRNNPNFKYDFNPNNWMKYYYNDLSIVCKIEELGKVLNIPRNLYHYLYRIDSISKIDYGNSAAIEGEELIKRIKEDRYEVDMDTLNRYFEPIYTESLCLMDYVMNSHSEQLKISYNDSLISSKKSKILKELFFDHDFCVNHISGDEDYIIFVVRNYSDLMDLIDSNRFEIGKSVQIAIPNHSEVSDFEKIISAISERYKFYYHVFNHCIINLIK